LFEEDGKLLNDLSRVNGKFGAAPESADERIRLHGLRFFLDLCAGQPRTFISQAGSAFGKLTGDVCFIFAIGKVKRSSVAIRKPRLIQDFQP
jgi:hypothetical protein